MLLSRTCPEVKPYKGGVGTPNRPRHKLTWPRGGISCSTIERSPLQTVIDAPFRRHACALPIFGRKAGNDPDRLGGQLLLEFENLVIAVGPLFTTPGKATRPPRYGFREPVAFDACRVPKEIAWKELPGWHIPSTWFAGIERAARIVRASTFSRESRNRFRSCTGMVSNLRCQRDSARPTNLRASGPASRSRFEDSLAPSKLS